LFPDDLVSRLARIRIEFKWKKLGLSDTVDPRVVHTSHQHALNTDNDCREQKMSEDSPQVLLLLLLLPFLEQYINGL
jgi:hypothetical protein